MGILETIAVYIFIWWITLFLVLPFGVRTQQEEGSVVPGTAESAPARPRLLRIALINTALATAVFIAVCLIIQYKLITADTIPFP
jgi:predicted secreted protein